MSRNECWNSDLSIHLLILNPIYLVYSKTKWNAVFFPHEIYTKYFRFNMWIFLYVAWSIASIYFYIKCESFKDKKHYFFFISYAVHSHVDLMSLHKWGRKLQLEKPSEVNELEIQVEGLFYLVVTGCRWGITSCNLKLNTALLCDYVTSKIDSPDLAKTTKMS